jgi:hypothetical protein
MPDIQIEDFKAGLDLRRMQFMTQAGTLLTARNVHINRGGEIEKRKAFVQNASLPAGTFGLLYALGALYTFGSQAAPTMPSGYAYQRLQDPSGSAMTGVVRARLFGGKPYVIATFANGLSHHFYDGTLVSHWSSGIVRSYMVDNFGIATHLAALIDAHPDYTATAAAGTITITGPLGRSFEVSGSTENGGAVNDQALVITKATFAVSARDDVGAIGSFRITGGTASAGVNYISDVVVSPDYPSGFDPLGGGYSILPSSVDWQGSNSQTIQAIADLINANTSTPGDFTADVIGQQLTITGVPGQGDTYNSYHITLMIEGDVIVTELGFQVTAGTSSPGVNRVTNIFIGGPDYLSAAVDWVTDNATTAEAIAAGVRAGGLGTAKAIGDVVRISRRGSGSGHGHSTFYDTFPINVVCGGNVRVRQEGDTAAGVANLTFTGGMVSGFTDISGGVDEYAGVAQVSRVSISGTFEPGDRFTITINDAENGDIVFGAGSVTGETAVDALALDTKMYAAFGSNVGFSAVNDATLWNYGTGVGFIGFSNVSGEMVDLKAVAEYEKKLAAFARSTVAIWNIDPDPDQNSRFQVLNNIGTLATRSVQSYGARDTYMLHDSGFRSLRPHSATENATTFDIGTHIDDAVVAAIAADEVGATQAHSIIEPESNRYWCYLNGKIYVLTQFSSEGVMGWSIYDEIPAFSEFEKVGRRVYARAGDIVYLYGGDSGAEYDDTEAEVELPYLHARKLAEWKRWSGINFAIEGLWQVYMNTDPDHPTREELIANFDHVSYHMEASQFDAEGPAIKLRFKSTAAERALISAVSVSYDDKDS